MAWNAEYTDEFGKWWAGLADGEQENITNTIESLAEYGQISWTGQRREIVHPYE